MKMVPCMTATGPILVEADHVLGVWAVHLRVMSLRGGGRMLLDGTYTVTHIPSGVAQMLEGSLAEAMLMAQRLRVDCPDATLTELLTKGSPVREAAKRAKEYAQTMAQGGAA